MTACPARERLEEALCSGQKHLRILWVAGGVGQGWAWRPPPSPLRALLLSPRLWSLVNCCSMCSLAPAPKTTQALRQMRNAAPDLSPQQRVPLGAKHGLWSLVPGSLPGASRQVEPRTQSHMQGEEPQGVQRTGAGLPQAEDPHHPPGTAWDVWVPRHPMPLCRTE